MVQLHTSGRYNIRRYVTKSERYMILAYDVMQSVRCSGACTRNAEIKTRKNFRVPGRRPEKFLDSGSEPGSYSGSGSEVTGYFRQFSCWKPEPGIPVETLVPPELRTWCQKPCLYLNLNKCILNSLEVSMYVCINVPLTKAVSVSTCV